MSGVEPAKNNDFYTTWPGALVCATAVGTVAAANFGTAALICYTAFPLIGIESIFGISIESIGQISFSAALYLGGLTVICAVAAAIAVIAVPYFSGGSAVPEGTA